MGASSLGGTNSPANGGGAKENQVCKQFFVLPNPELISLILDN